MDFLWHTSRCECKEGRRPRFLSAILPKFDARSRSPLPKGLQEAREVEIVEEKKKKKKTGNVSKRTGSGGGLKEVGVGLKRLEVKESALMVRENRDDLK